MVSYFVSVIWRFLCQGSLGGPVVQNPLLVKGTAVQPHGPRVSGARVPQPWSASRCKRKKFMYKILYMKLRVETGSSFISDNLMKPVWIVSKTSDQFLWNELFKLVKSSY